MTGATGGVGLRLQAAAESVTSTKTNATSLATNPSLSGCLSRVALSRELALLRRSEATHGAAKERLQPSRGYARRTLSQ